MGLGGRPAGPRTLPPAPLPCPELKLSCGQGAFLPCSEGCGPACRLLRPDMADLTVPVGSMMRLCCCRTFGGNRAMLTPYGTAQKHFSDF